MAPKVDFNTELLRQEQYAKMRAGYGAVNGTKNTSTAFTAQTGNVGSPTLSPSDMARLSGIAEKNALKGKGISSTTEAAAGTAAAPVQVSQITPVAKPAQVDGKQAISFNNGVKTETSDALKFNARMASLNYAQTAEKSRNMGQYAPLSSSKIPANNVFAQTNTSASNPFAGQYTGLSFKYDPNDIIA